MRPDRLPTQRDAPTPPLDPPLTARGTALLTALLAAVLVVASHPIPSAAFVAGVLAARCGVRAFARRLRPGAIRRRLAPVCVPGTNVCLGA
ncbi:hypothetical protein [Halorubrum sodomense]|uniref:Uncharacterized protein n=1 Tax=Halorubrum sodomense TaxID=35743 RepID=A0A1I6FL52_HALSD|nr:hypothetical protein [Halorubrum sodomense]SFR30537.1 hypothetical protein SAMN04487937_0363 [Halorubrum sodomense]